ncbi:MAG: DUF3391 domain-containing protein [Alteromonadaceae bacterium]|nr:DUF3391 domain-containing protein [Alteromonadaceae bacterium]
MAKKVAIQDVKPGMVILSVVEQNGPVRIRKSGLVTSVEMVQGLAEMGVITVSIDPDQTVELEPEEPHVSQTQFVMKANAEKPTTDTDSHLQEQFNRSLFMPSLQKVPSAWQYYSKQIAVAVIVSAGGFGFGWGGANYQDLFAAQEVTKVAPSQSIEGAASDNQAAEVSNLDGDSIETPVLAKTKPISDSASTTEITSEQSASSQNQTDNISQPSAQIGSAAADTQDVVQEELAAVNTTAPSAQADPNNQVSSELMQRFEKAMADLEAESANDSYSVGDDAYDYDSNRDLTVDYYQDVPRVDQLPARVMTRLPSVSFSAHMYATDPEQRWVKVNGVELGEGEWITENLFLEKIEPQKVILLFQGHQFSMRALSDW